ncbi:JAB domain-containing protein [Pseudoflavonifractor phocaeensis]|uniref:JAB domain-containing protein n=1 Tax=Pseudoflavonifractor phocaeensis TaxID=1870988 RepID=UPI001F4501F6|nr:DNA repair protein RadC [Pseudoflavonifractor phocaeensis]MCF2661674.1 DNA repair protein RadC [Pseudoflavonifractor phocaeensis]
MSIHAGHRSRVKTEFLARGLEGWPDHRVLELLLFYAIPQGDVNTLAHELLNRFETLAGVFDASVDELKKVPGVGEHTAVLLRLIPALGRRYQDQRAALGQLVNSPEEAAAILSQYFYGARNEMVYILCLDSKRKLLGVRKVSEGSIHAADINIRRIAEEAMGLRASALYLAHNHISNLAFPSPADWETTDTIRAALAPLGLELVDHLIFVEGDAVSLNQSERGGKRPVYQLL